MPTSATLALGFLKCFLTFDGEFVELHVKRPPLEEIPSADQEMGAGRPLSTPTG